MFQRALYELAEATLGLAPEMLWSVDEEIARRESKRLFERVYEGTTAPEAALEVFMITMTLKTQHTTSVIEERYNRVLATLTHDEQDSCPALNEFFEFFTGLSQSAHYSMNGDISRKELLPLFEACYNGLICWQDCQNAVFDNTTAKRDTTLLALQGAVQRLQQQLSGLVRVKAEPDDATKDS